MAICFHHMAPHTPDIGEAILPVVPPNQCVQGGFTGAVAQPLIIGPKPDNIRIYANSQAARPFASGLCATTCGRRFLRIDRRQ